jgi:hypothetical protein
MRGIKPDETLTQYLIRRAFETGHFWGPDNLEGWSIRSEDLSKLKASDDVVIQALRSFARSDVRLYAQHVYAAHERAPDFDGQPGPAMVAFSQASRCPVPDFRPPVNVEFAFEDPLLDDIVRKMQADQVQEAGAGNWQGCHDVGGYHCAVVQWNLSGMPSHLNNGAFADVLKRVQKAYAGVGLLLYFVDGQGVDLITEDDRSDLRANINASFVRSSDGWIGLAIVGRTETCTTNPIWCRYLATYRGGSNREQVVTQWTTLIMHELGHNCGRLHTNGGVMNPSLVNGLPGVWGPQDPSTRWMQQQFGGTPVPIPDDDDGDVPVPDPPSDIEQEFERLRIDVLINELNIADLKRRVRVLEG